MLNQFIDILRAEFGTQILDKTAYGRNEIKLVLERAMSNAALKYLSEAGNTSALDKPEEKKDAIQNNPQ